MTTTTLFTNLQGGEICCIEHVGNYSKMAISARPKARRWKTPFGVWERWTEADDAAWVAEFGRPAECEGCHPPRARFDESDLGGAFDGFQVTSDAEGGW